MTPGKPDKIRLVPDDYHISHAGTLADGRLFWVTQQLDFSQDVTRDYVCTFIFDADGNLVDHTIDSLGFRGTYPDGQTREIYEKHLAVLGDYEIANIWIRLFEVAVDDVVIGLIPVAPEEFMEEGDDPEDLDEDDWRVEFMPGNTLSFYPPWEDGEYDT